MIIYSVTCSVETSIEEEWVQWMQEIHIPEVMDTKIFTAHTMCEVLSNASGSENKSYNIQYEVESMEDLHKYNTQHAPALKEKTMRKFGEKCIAFRSILRKI